MLYNVASLSMWLSVHTLSCLELDNNLQKEVVKKGLNSLCKQCAFLYPCFKR